MYNGYNESEANFDGTVGPGDMMSIEFGEASCRK